MVSPNCRIYSNLQENLKIVDSVQNNSDWYRTLRYLFLQATPLFLEIKPEQFLVLFRPGTTSVRSGLGTFFVPEPEHAKHFLCS